MRSPWSITVSRSFGRPVESFEEVREALAHFASRAAEKLRREASVASVLAVFLMTSRFRPEWQQAGSAVVHLPLATDYTPELIRAAQRGLERIFVEGYQYKKAGVMLTGLAPCAERQAGLFVTRTDDHSQRLMQTVDRINRRMGAGTLRYAAAGYKQCWQTRAEQRTPRYTTCWDELLTLPPL